jgi:hypothetical protein
MRERSPSSVDEARLLPRFRERSPILDRRSMLRAQAAVLRDAVEATPEKPEPIRRELTKPGDPQRLRGIPAIGPSVAGAIPGTNPATAACSERSAA